MAGLQRLVGASLSLITRRSLVQVQVAPSFILNNLRILLRLRFSSLS